MFQMQILPPLPPDMNISSMLGWAESTDVEFERLADVPLPMSGIIKSVKESQTLMKQ